MTRIALAVIGSAFLMAAVASPALASPVPATTPVIVAASTSPAADAPEAAVLSKLDTARQEIFRILCGGTEPHDESLAAHLWQVAGSLALRDWTPPTVTVRVVRSSTEASR